MYSKGLERLVDERTKELNRALYDTEKARDNIDGILKSVSDGLIVTDIYNRIVLMNRAVEDMFNVRLSESINRPVDYAIREESLSKKFIEVYSEKQDKNQFYFELPGPRYMRARTSLIKDRKGVETGYITVITDETREYEIDRMKTEFLSTAAHELRTPLTSIMGFSELLQTRDNIIEEDRKKYLSYINDQSKNLANIINDLLDVSRIESGRGDVLDKEECDIGGIIKQAVQLFQETYAQRKLRITLPEEPVKIVIDGEKIGQVVKNLLSNAVNYSPGDSEIKVLGEVHEDFYQVSVEDSGIGMTPEQVEKIFDKFYRANASDDAPPGTGLGMTIVRDIVEKHEGKVWVESIKGKGTIVRFTIPYKS